jgi:glutaredoxin-related protein
MKQRSKLTSSTFPIAFCTMSLHEKAKYLIVKSVEENDMLIVIPNSTKKSFLNEILLHDFFRKHSIKLEILNIDRYRDEDAAVIHQELAKLTKQPSFPYVWVNGTYLGGISQTKRALRNGDLEYFLHL